MDSLPLVTVVTFKYKILYVISVKIKIAAILALVFVFLCLYSYGQEVSGKYIKIGYGIGASMGKNTSGSGFVYTLGYQKEIWNDRLRFNPNFSLGQYSAIFLPLDARDQYFNAVNLEANLFFDLLKHESVSLVVGCGALVNHSKGLKGGGGLDFEYEENFRSEYISNFHFAGYLGGGIRINHPQKRTAINILPFNVHFGTNDFAEFFAKIELDIKL